MKRIEKKWQKKWLKEKLYEPNFGRAKKPFYNLMMFPYLSAEGLHIGAARTFSGVDIYGRFKRMQGYDVFEPIGLDGFGIHSENYALKIGKHPAQHAKDSEKNFYRQLNELGNGFAWEERLETYDPAYYKWTQWIFTQMFIHGLAYRKKAPVNWCPSCKTVLADEQVLQGECERCETKVIKKELEQWFFRITDYTERLLKNVDTLDWPESIKIAQRNWIGKSEGAEIEFRIKNQELRIKVFTTRPDTIFGATYLVLSPEHSIIENLKLKIENWEEVRTYIRNSKNEKEEIKEKTGVELKGIKAINPANGEEIPIWVADYVLGNVGTGAIMAVPAHDERDFEFAKKFDLPIRQVIEPTFMQSTEPGKIRDGIPFDHREAIIAIVKHWSQDRYMALRWKKVAWGTFITGGIENDQTPEEAAKMEIAQETGYLHPKLIKDFGVVHGKFYHVPKKINRHAHAHVLYFELQDNARTHVTEEEQEIHEVLWLTKKELTGFLTSDSHKYGLKMLFGEADVYTDDGTLTNSAQFNRLESIEARDTIVKFVSGEQRTQYHLRDWLISRQRYWGPPIPMIYCEKCNWQPVPEKDLPVKLPYAKDFRPTGTEQSPLATIKKFWKVKCPTCGEWARRETDVSDSFLDSSWYYLGYLLKIQNQPAGRAGSKLKTQNFSSAIFKKWLPVHSYIGGSEHAVLHLLYSRFVAMALHDWGVVHFEEPFTRFRAHGLITKDGAKMSKSRGNVVSPDAYIEKYGADAVRMYLAFLAPLDEGGDFRDRGIKGITRFLDRGEKFIKSKITLSSDRMPRHVMSTWHDRMTGQIQKIIHQTIKKVTEDIEALHYNTAISALMILLNAFEKEKESVGRKDIEIFLKLLAPFAPFATEELWHEKLGNKKSIHIASWPVHDPRLLEEQTIQCIIQVNGKVRDTIEVRKGIYQKEAERLARGRDRIKPYLEGKTVRKIIFVPNRLINFVV